MVVYFLAIERTFLLLIVPSNFSVLNVYISGQVSNFCLVLAYVQAPK